MYQTDKRRLSSMLLFERCLTTKWKSRWNALKALCQWKSASGRVSPVSSASHRRYFSGGFRRGNQVTARERKRQRNRRTEAVNTDEQFLFISENQLQITGLSFFCITEHKRLQNDALSGFFCLLFVKKKETEFDPKWQPVWVLISHQRLKTGCWQMRSVKISHEARANAHANTETTPLPRLHPAG